MPNGYAELGAMLGGLGANTEAAYADQLRRHGRAADAFYQARQSRAQAIAREGLGEALAGIYGPEQAALATAVLGSANTPNLGNLGAFEDPAAQALFAEREQAFREGNYKRMNAATAVLGDKQYEPLTLGGGGKVVFDPVEGASSLTPLGDAAVDAENALTQQRVMAGEAARTRAEAAAAREAARAGVYERTDPNRPRGGKPQPAQAPAENPLIAQARAAIAQGADPDAVRRRLRELGHADLAGSL